MILRILKTEPLASLMEYGTWADDHPHIDNGIFSKTDDELRYLIKDRFITLYVSHYDVCVCTYYVFSFHPTSSAKMGKLEDGGVVDAKLYVHGVSGLRIVDASIMPTIVSGHTVSRGLITIYVLLMADVTAFKAAAAIAIGEKAADMMKEALVGKR